MTTTRPTTELVTDTRPRRRSPRRGLLDKPCREITAALRAGVPTIPCLVRDMTDAERIEVMLVENLQRSGIMPLAEASGYFRLVGDHGYTIRRLAKQVGRSERHVRARLALLELPTAAQAALEKDDLTVGQAEALLAAKDRPGVIEGILAEADWRRRDMSQVVADALRRAEHEERRLAMISQLEAGGTRVLAPEGPRPRSYVRLSELGLDEGAHQKEPCHAAVVEFGYAGPITVAVCSDRRRHSRKASADARSELQVESPGPDPEREQAKERRRLAMRRNEFLTSRLPARLPKAPVVNMIVRMLVERANANDVGRAGNLLGLEARPGRYGDDWHGTLLEVAARSEPDRLRVGLAVAAATAEARIAACGYRNGAEGYVAFLATLGYEPEEGEGVAVGPDDLEGFAGRSIDGSGAGDPSDVV